MRRELQVDILLGAYGQGIFPMAVEDGEIEWFSPDPRAILPLNGFRISKNLRRRCASGRFEVTVDRDFAAVIAACAERPEGTWISPEIKEAYTKLHEFGFAHSVETRLDDSLVGGLYGVTLGGAFFGESMFHRVSDASKVSLVFLVDRMRERGFSLLDVQFSTDHLMQFGVLEIARERYIERLNFASSQTCEFAD